ncbi:MAG TPA: endosialidase, partial [Lachnospiraceae bacterium]|nr:endosialidase [Lachnospiraceae bacterium]
MAVVPELIREEENGAISFGNYELKEKTKQDGFKYNGDSYKIKTFYEITKLERNGA